MRDDQLQIEDVPVSEQFVALQRLNKDLKVASRLLGQREVRYLTDTYYQVQKFRTIAANQIRSCSSGEPNQVLTWTLANMKTLENDIKKSLDEFSDQYSVGRWLKSIVGIGPVITAGLLSHLDIRLCKTAGHFQSFAGMVPSQHWAKGQKRPWNAKLKRLVFLATDCFMKFQNHKNDTYGKLYVKRKEYETAKNLKGDYKDNAAYILTGNCPRCNGQSNPACFICYGRCKVTPKRFGEDTKAIASYKEGMLPLGHIHMRCLRWTGKIFLSHLHTAMYVDFFKSDPPVPYVFAKCAEDHRHFIDLPNWPNKEQGNSLAELYGRSIAPIPMGDASEDDNDSIPEVQGPD